MKYKALYENVFKQNQISQQLLEKYNSKPKMPDIQALKETLNIKEYYIQNLEQKMF